MTKEVDIKPWDIDWQPEQIARFWDWWSNNAALESFYFSKTNGDSVIAQVSRHIQLSGTVVDLGAGPGFLVEKLLQRGVDTLAIDLSPESIANLDARLSAQPHFLGAYTNSTTANLGDSFADVVFVMETIEHLNDAALETLLLDAKRILKPGGHVVVTTPREENLDESKRMCPNCGCVFHIVQHVRSWSVDTLRARMVAGGFQAVVCKPTLFASKNWLRRMWLKLRGRHLPHLLFIGEKIG